MDLYRKKNAFMHTVFGKKNSIISDNHKPIIAVEPDRIRIFRKDSRLDQLHCYAHDVLARTGYRAVVGLIFAKKAR